MRTNLILAIVAMGVMGMVYSLVTGEVYQRLALESRKAAFVELAELEVHYQLNYLVKESYQLGMSVQNSEIFKLDYTSANAASYISYLDEHFHRAYVTLGLLDLRMMMVYDKEFKLLYQSSERDGMNPSGLICPELFQLAKNRVGTDRIKPISRTCKNNGEIRTVSLVAIGGLRLRGYLALVVNPIPNLSKAEHGVGTPLEIRNMAGKLLYRSENWPDQQLRENLMLADYYLHAANIEPISVFTFASNVTKLHEQLLETRNTMFWVVSGVTLLTVLLMLLLFQRAILTPLNLLTIHLKNVHMDHVYLKNKIEIGGAKELHELGDDFNLMCEKLNSLYGQLENMAFTDSLTGIPNRALLFDRLKQYTRMAKRDSDRGQYIFMMLDLNRFKPINDTYGHHAGDLVLKEVAKRLDQVLRESDTLARLGGDEFAVILYGINEKQTAERIACLITETLAQPIDFNDRTIVIGMSIGIACYPGDGDDYSRIIHCADLAMYHAKKKGIPYSFYRAELDHGR